MPIRLVVKSKAQTGDQAPQEHLLDAEQVFVGRDASCNVVLAESVVSRKHLSIVREGALYFLEDLGSSFGTRVNGAALPPGEKRLLRNGDVIAVGPYDLTFDRIADSAGPGAAEKTSFVAKRVVKDALRNLSSAGEGPTLRVMNGPLEGKRFELHHAQELVVGREAGVDIQLEDDLVSRRHAQFRRDWTGCHVEDLGSRNGIRVNRKRVESQALKDRDEVEVGSVRFLFLDPSEVREAPVMPEAPPPPAPPQQPAAAPASAARRPSTVRAAPAKPAVAPAPEPEAKPEPKPEAKPPRPAPKPPTPEPEPESEQPEHQAEEQEDEEQAPDEGEGQAGEPGDEPSDQEEEKPSRKPFQPEAEPQEQASPADWKGKLTSPEAVRSLLPVLVVVGVAIFAVALLLVTFFVI